LYAKVLSKLHLKSSSSHLFTDVDDHILLRDLNITVPYNRISVTQQIYKGSEINQIYHPLRMTPAFIIEQKMNENLYKGLEINQIYHPLGLGLAFIIDENMNENLFSHSSGSEYRKNNSK